MTKYNGSTVWAEFEKIAAESKLITPDLTPEQEHIENRKKDVATGDDYTRNPKTEEYDVTEGEGKDIVEKAHKEDAQVASAMGKGGLVENLIQQQEKDIEVALKMPDGALHGVHASVVSDLVKLANSLDEAGEDAAAKRVDATIKEIRNLPFVDGHLRKEAAWFLPLLGLLGKGGLIALKSMFTLKGAAAVGLTVGGLKMFGAKLTSQVNNLSTDVNDLYESLTDSADDSNSARKAAEILAPYNSGFQSADISNEQGYREFEKLANKLHNELPNLSKNILRIKEDYQMGLWEKAKGLIGLESPNTIIAAFDDMKTSLKTSRKLLSGGNNLKKRVEEGAAALSSAPMLEIINKLTEGQELDSETAEKLVNLEKQLTNQLSDDIAKEDGTPYDFSGKIVSGGKLVIDPQQLKKIVELANRVNR